ncbi:MAG: PRC-barrel domain-containing protein [Actinomycetota bacterium]
MSDPVSWFLIEAGWTVVDSTGDDVGRVEEIVGDSGEDIFNGLTVSAGLLRAPRYVPAERVAEITEGRVRLDLTKSEVKDLDAHEPEPPSQQFRPG